MRNLNHIIVIFCLCLLNRGLAQDFTSAFYASEYNHVLSTSVGDYLSGSLVIPAGDSASTVVLMINEIGNIDRDGNTRTYRNFCMQKLAFSLAERNIASLRYDIRGVGASRTSARFRDIAFEDYVRDASEWIGLLRRDGRFRHVVVLGHGLGGLVAIVALSKNTKADGLVLVNCDSESYGDALKSRFSDQSFLVRDVVYSIVDSLSMGYDVEMVPVFLSSTLSASRQSFVRSIMRYEPMDLFKLIKVKSLIIGGETDIEVPVDNSVRFAKVNKRSQSLVITGMNHVLKSCYTLDRDYQHLTYANPAMPINRTLVDCISNFVHTIR